MNRTILLASALVLAAPVFAQTTTDDMSTTTNPQTMGSPDAATSVGQTANPGMTHSGTHSGTASSSTSTSSGTMDTMSSTGTTTGTSSGSWSTNTSSGMSGTAMASSGQMVQPGNSNPERDARGIAVMSDPATVPAGWNGMAGTGMGGPLVDPATGSESGAQSYPACSRTVTDNCLQTYERGRR